MGPRLCAARAARGRGETRNVFGVGRFTKLEYLILNHRCFPAFRRVGSYFPFRQFLTTTRAPCRSVIFAFRWGAQKRCPSGGAGASTQWMDDRLYSRRCDVTKPQLAIGLFSRAHRRLKGPGVGRGSAFRTPCYASTNRRGRPVSYPAVCSKWATPVRQLQIGREPHKRPKCWMTIRAWGDATPEHWIDGRQHRPLRRRHSGKGRAVPVRLSLILTFVR
jgi:hypothetical protein